MRSMTDFQAKRIRIIGAPLDLGSGRRGVDMGPSALRVAGLERRLEGLGHAGEDAGDLEVEIPETQAIGDPKLRYAETIVRAAEALAERTQGALDAGCMPLVLGGDHSIAIGSLAGSVAHFRAMRQELGVVWVDAH